MKKQKKGIAILLSIITILMALLLTSCDSRTKTIGARCPLDHTVFNMPFKPEVAVTFGHGTSFSTKLTLAEIKGQVDGMTLSEGQSVCTTVYGENMLIELTTAEGYVHNYFLTFAHSMEDGKPFYYLSPPYLSTDKAIVLVPKHFYNTIMVADGVGRSPVHHTEDVAYPVHATLAEFAAFYTKTNMFEVVSQANSITVTAKAMTMKDAGGIFAESFVHEKNSFTVTLETKGELTLATVHVVAAA